MMLTKSIKNIPKTLIYNPPNTNKYNIFRTNSSKKLGEMIAYPTNNNDIYIERLVIYREKRTGLGKTLLDFAQNLSKKYGFKGRMSLVAGTLPEDPFNPPHIFYRKYGFSTKNKKILKFIDEHINSQKQLNYLTTHNIMMYYVPENKNYLEPSFFQKIKERFLSF